MLKLWTELFTQLGVNLLFSTAYHPQTDGSSERTNQTAEIALRFSLWTIDNPKLWSILLHRLQAQMSNAKSATTTMSPNEVAYEFSIRRQLDLATLSEQVDASPVTTRATASDALSFAQMSQKMHYDRRHTPLISRQPRS